MTDNKKPQESTGVLVSISDRPGQENSYPNNTTNPPLTQLDSLGTITDTGGHSAGKAVLKQDMLAAAKQLLPNENRLQGCLVATVDKKKPVGIEYAGNTETPKARLTNVCRCENPWLCPNCGPTVAEQKARMIKEDLIVWGLAGNTAGFVVFTLQHFAGESLQAVDKRIDGALRKLFSNRSGREFMDRWKVAGKERSPDLTVGENGWHSHRNYVFFLERRLLSDRETLDFERELSDLWGRAVGLVGGYASQEVGCKVRFGDMFNVADYIASKAMGCGGQQVDKSGQADGWGVAEELTKHQYKRGDGLTPTDLLRVYLFGDHPVLTSDRAGKLWQEYARVFKGKKFVDTSPGFRARLDKLKEQFAEELASELSEDVRPEFFALAYLGPEAWRQVVKLQLALWLLAEVKECRGDPVAVRLFLVENEIYQVYYPDLDERLPDWWFAPEGTPQGEVDGIREFNDFVKDWNSQPWPVGQHRHN